ncbi:MAG: hypothetical protein Q4G45_12510 [Actinomycetia bacterium]|nr:hypothetical protein [Actinomycetes bacterium]
MSTRVEGEATDAPRWPVLSSVREVVKGAPAPSDRFRVVSGAGRRAGLLGRGDRRRPCRRAAGIRAQ